MQDARQEQNARRPDRPRVPLRPPGRSRDRRRLDRQRHCDASACSTTAVWYLDMDGDGRWSDGDLKCDFGQAGDMPVVGDWTGDGIEKIGVYRNGTLVSRHEQQPPARCRRPCRSTGTAWRQTGGRSTQRSCCRRGLPRDCHTGGDSDCTDSSGCEVNRSVWRNEASRVLELLHFGLGRCNFRLQPLHLARLVGLELGPSKLLSQLLQLLMQHVDAFFCFLIHCWAWWLELPQ